MSKMVRADDVVAFFAEQAEFSDTDQASLVTAGTAPISLITAGTAPTRLISDRREVPRPIWPTSHIGLPDSMVVKKDSHGRWIIRSGKGDLFIPLDLFDLEVGTYLEAVVDGLVHQFSLQGGENWLHDEVEA